MTPAITLQQRARREVSVVNTMLKMLVVCLLVSYGLSVGFWLGLGVFNLPGFILGSAAAGFAGAIVGWLAGRSLLLAVVATAVIRIALFIFMTHGVG